MSSLTSSSTRGSFVLASTSSSVSLPSPAAAAASTPSGLWRSILASRVARLRFRQTAKMRATTKKHARTMRTRTSMAESVLLAYFDDGAATAGLGTGVGPLGNAVGAGGSDFCTDGGVEMDGHEDGCVVGSRVVGDGEGRAVGCGEGNGDGSGVGRDVGCVGLDVGAGVGTKVSVVGCGSDGTGEGGVDGSSEGALVGNSVGSGVGDRVDGEGDGSVDGSGVGGAEGRAVGAAVVGAAVVGDTVGLGEGAGDGRVVVGASEREGARVVGCRVGSYVGAGVGWYVEGLYDGIAVVGMAVVGVAEGFGVEVGQKEGWYGRFRTALAMSGVIAT
mmetsp:Transcript_19127/g.60134  ORF Transcript_19127/g.60134 Transcript_19127/m.60134 type:complete len:331 (+) Transcript_19127:169-1161(+)